MVSHPKGPRAICQRGPTRVWDMPGQQDTYNKHSTGFSANATDTRSLTPVRERLVLERAGSDPSQSQYEVGLCTGLPARIGRCRETTRTRPEAVKLCVVRLIGVRLNMRASLAFVSQHLASLSALMVPPVLHRQAFLLLSSCDRAGAKVCRKSYKHPAGLGKSRDFPGKGHETVTGQKKKAGLISGTLAP